MNICGIIAEYNPFHNGHLYHLRETRRALGWDTLIICAMSGNFVQRGEPAIVDKYRRAAAAVQCGADLVFELPLAACLSSAEGFAAGGVQTLAATGLVTTLSFGCECGDAEQIAQAAMLREQPEVQQHFQKALRQGLSYAAAWQAAAAKIDPQAAALLSSPNNTLSLEYSRAVRQLPQPMRLLAIARRGAAHDDISPVGNTASASFLRALLLHDGLASCADYLPLSAIELLQDALQAGDAPVTLSHLDRALLGILRRLQYSGELQFASNDGFSERLQRAIAEGADLAQIADTARTRRFPLARVRRALLRACLDIADGAPVAPSYLRVLAMSPSGRTLLRAMRDSCPLPVITKPVTERDLPQALQPALRQDAFADDLFALGLPCYTHHKAGGHFRASPFCLT